jgi:hypothetical protein
MLLLLLWRHLDFFARKEQITVSDLKASHTGMTRLLAVPETETFRTELRRRLAPMFQRLYLVSISQNRGIIARKVDTPAGP